MSFYQCRHAVGLSTMAGLVRPNITESAYRFAIPAVDLRYRVDHPPRRNAWRLKMPGKNDARRHNPGPFAFGFRFLETTRANRVQTNGRRPTQRHSTDAALVWPILDRRNYATIDYCGCHAMHAGCLSTPAGVSITSRAPKDSTESQAPFEAKRTWIFVEGTQTSTTPATVTVRRSFEVTNVSLHVGATFEEVRHFEIERTVTASRTMLDYTFSGSFNGGYLTFNATELSQDRKGRYIIPYFEGPIQIIDHEYDLVLIVQE